MEVKVGLKNHMEQAIVLNAFWNSILLSTALQYKMSTVKDQRHN